MRAPSTRAVLIAGVLLSAPGLAAQAPSGGSAVPCAVPLGWRIAEVDERLGLTSSEARVAMENASRLWETAVGRTLFPEDLGQGMPVAFEYDDRQATQQMRARLEDELRTLGAALDDSRLRLEEQVEALRSVQAEYEARAAALGRSMDAHNAEVLRWNREGGAPDTVRTRLDGRAEALDAERDDLQRQAEELQRIQTLLSRETALLNQRIQERNERANELGRAHPPTYTEAGRYSESVQTRNGEVVDVRRAIEVYRFSNREELVLVLAHELGHALGLGHSSVPGAVMHEVTRSGVGAGITADDLALLAARCPGLR